MTRAEVTHPLDETLAQFAGKNEKSSDPLASFGPLTGSGWYLASDLLADEGALDEVLECYGACRETTWPFLQAALLMHPYGHSGCVGHRVWTLRGRAGPRR